MNLHEPDLEALRSTVQDAHMNSDCAKDWPEGVLDKVNALGA